MNGVPYDLSRLLSQEEGQYFDRKSLWEGLPGNKSPCDRRWVRDTIAEYVAAFANADGGMLILGMEDDGVVTGHGYPDDVIETFLAVPQHRLNPPLSPGRRVQYQDHELLIFDIQSEPRAVMMVGNGFPRRSDDRVIQESEEVINTIKNRNRRESYEQEPCLDVAFRDLDFDLIGRCVISAGLGNLTPDEYLIERRLAHRRGTDLVLSRGAVLLFAKKA